MTEDYGLMSSWCHEHRQSHPFDCSSGDVTEWYWRNGDWVRRPETPLVWEGDQA